MKKLLSKLAPALTVVAVLLAGCAKEAPKMAPGDLSGASPMSGPPGSTGKTPGVGGPASPGGGAPPGHGPAGAPGAR